MEQSVALDAGLVKAQDEPERHRALHEVRGLGDPVVFLPAFILLLLFCFKNFYLTFRETVVPW